MKNTKRFLLCVMLLMTCLMVFTLVGCDTLLGGGEHEHEFVKHEAKEPTCTEEGWLAYVTCSGCKDYTTFKSVPALGHDLSENYVEGDENVHSRVCSRCTYSVDMPHDWKKVGDAVLPTCTEDGKQDYSCSTCGREKTETIKALGHSYPEKYSPVGDVHTLTCSRCLDKKEEPHSWYLIMSSDPTCTEDGVTYYGCDACGGSKNVVTPANGHSFPDNYQPDADTHSLTCSDCGETFEGPHDWVKVGVEKEPTCAETGIEVYACSVCGYEKRITLPKVDEHFDGEWEITSSPTATVDGLKVLHCAVCNKVIKEEVLTCDAKTMPVLYFTGEYKNATNAKNEVEMGVTYTNPNGEEFTAYATIKVQGSSSVAYDKKNYTVKFYKDDTYDSKLKYDFGWGKENKYVIKANWVDFSNARNIVSCKLWGDIVASRPESENQKRLAALKTNAGAIDGFPISVYMNGEFHGIYTLNVPKDEWMFGMDDSPTEALIASDDWNHTDFYSLVESFYEASNGDILSKNNGWELIYCGSDDYSWVAESFDKLIKFCQDNEGDDFRAGIENYLDVDAAIDYCIFMYANCMHDNASKNMLWATYDGKTWIPSVYDQDGTFGQYWDGVRIESPERFLPQVVNGKIDVNITYGPSGNNNPKFILWDRILNAYTDEIVARYYELRETTLSTENIVAELKKVEDAIPASVYEADAERWAESRTKWWEGKSKPTPTWDYTNYHFDFMYEWMENRMNCYDAVIAEIAEFAETK